MTQNEKSNLLKQFADQSDKLFDLGIIRTDSFTGEIGEYVSSIVFKLKNTERVTRAIDGIDKKGRKYQVKAKVVDNDKVNYGIGNLDIEEIDYLVIVYFDYYYTPKRIIRIKANQLPEGKVGISKKFLNSIKYEILESSEIQIPKVKQKEISKFGQLYEALRKNEIIRSRRIVGDLGEFYACQYLKLSLNENKNEKGVDAVDKNGVKYEVKTRRVYESGRRKSKSRRLNNLVGKESKYLIVVALDRSFNCAGIWKIPLKNVQNPKSAHLGIVNTTLGVEKVVKSKIDWLY